MRRGLALIASGVTVLAMVMLPAPAGATPAQPTGLWPSNFQANVTSCDSQYGSFPRDANNFCYIEGDGAVELGAVFTTSKPVLVSGVRIYRTDPGTVTGSLWDPANTSSPLASGTFATQTGHGWQDLLFSSPVAMSIGDTYVASYHVPDGDYAFEYNYAFPFSDGTITELGAGINGVYTYCSPGPCYPSTSSGTNYWVTPLWIPDYTISGFYDPVDMGMLNTVKAGSTVPLKFEVFWGDQEQTNTAVVGSFAAKTIPCSSVASISSDAIEFTTTGGSSLRYDATAGQFIQNWKTPKPKGCYEVTMTTGDGSSIAADFKLT